VFEIATQEIAKHPWRKALEDEKCELSTMVELCPKMFTGRQRVLVDIANQLKLSDTDITSFMTLPLINGDREIMAAIALQNLLHPKNSHRREAIESHSYVAIMNLEQARTVLTQILSTNMKNELAGRETAVRTELLSAKSQMSANTFLIAPDIYFSAAVLLNEKLLIGSGDRTRILYTIKK